MKQYQKELTYLARDFGLSNHSKTEYIIQTCKNYSDGWRKLMKLYDIEIMHYTNDCITENNYINSIIGLIAK